MNMKKRPIKLKNKLNKSKKLRKMKRKTKEKATRRRGFIFFILFI
jgi:hypothetical protein